MSRIHLPELETITFEWLDDDVVVMRLNRPERMNTQTVRMFQEYNDAARALAAALPRVVILTGAGERAFCAGFDLDEIGVLTTMSAREFLVFQETAAAGVAALRSLQFPVIAAVHGPAVGGGLSLALAADIRMAAPSAKFSAAFVRLGLSVGELGTSWNLTRIVGPGRAAELAYTGRTVDAEEACRIGLVNYVVPTEQLMERTIALAREICANSAGGVRLSKRALLRNQEVGSYESAMELESRGQALLTRDEDIVEALAALKERRPARFTNWTSGQSR